MDRERRRQQISQDRKLKRYYWTTEKRKVVKKIFRKEILDPKLSVTSKKLGKVRAILQSRDICPEYDDFNFPKIRTYVHRLRKERTEKLKNKLPVSPMPSDTDDSDDSDEDTGVRAVACRLTPAQTKILKKMFQKELADPGLQVPISKLFKARYKLEDAGALWIDNQKIRTWVYNNRAKWQAKRERGESSDSDECISTESEDEELPLRNKKRICWTEWMIKIMKEHFSKELNRQLSVYEDKVENVCILLQSMGARDLTRAQVRSWVNNNRSHYKLRTVEAEQRREDAYTLLWCLYYKTLEDLTGALCQIELERPAISCQTMEINESVNNSTTTTDESSTKSTPPAKKPERNNRKKEKSPEIKMRRSARIKGLATKC